MTGPLFITLTECVEGLGTREASINVDDIARVHEYGGFPDGPETSQVATRGGVILRVVEGRHDIINLVERKKLEQVTLLRQALVGALSEVVEAVQPLPVEVVSTVKRSHHPGGVQA